MSYDAVYFFKDIIILLLIFALVIALQKMRSLKLTLEIEKRKRTMPLITMELNSDDDSGVFLTNDSYCYAKNINIEDLDVTVDYGFKKHLTLKFSPLDMLKPSARIKLDYRVFDDEYDITSNYELNILNHFSDAPVEMNLRYENIEGSAFKSCIGYEKNQYIIKEAAPA